MQTMSERLKWVRKQFEYTQTDLAKRSGVALSTIRRIEQENFNLRLSTVDRLAETLQIRSAWLVYGEEPMVSSSDVDEQRRSKSALGTVNTDDGPWYRLNGKWAMRSSSEGNQS